MVGLDVIKILQMSKRYCFLPLHIFNTNTVKKYCNFIVQQSISNQYRFGTIKDLARNE